MDIKNVAVVGAGIMGSGVGHNLAKYGYNVILLDRSNYALENAKNNISIKIAVCRIQTSTTIEARMSRRKISIRATTQ